MIIDILIVIIAVVVIALIVNYFEGILRYERYKISLKESLDLAQVPIITLQEGSSKLNFLLDSGSSHSHISTEASKLLVGDPVNTEYSYITSMGVDNTTSKTIESILKYKDKEFKVTLFVNENLSESFRIMKEDCGVQVHGILGSNFLEEHRYVLDFADKIAYTKK